MRAVYRRPKRVEVSHNDGVGDRPRRADPFAHQALLGPPDPHRYDAMLSLARRLLRCGTRIEVITTVKSWRRFGNHCFHEVEAEVWIGSGKKRRSAVRHVGCGVSDQAAAFDASYFALRRLLFGDVPVTGVLVDTPGAALTLELTADGPRVVLHLKGALRRDRRGLAQTLPTALVIPAVLDPKGAQARTSYVRLTGISKAIKNLYGGLLNFKKTVRLHQLVAAIEAGAGGKPYGPGYHVHHRNGYGPDCRIDNLVCLLPKEHADEHRHFFEVPSQDGALCEQMPVELDSVSMMTSEAPRRKSRMKTCHSRQYGVLSWHRAMREYRQGLREEPKPLADDEHVLSAISSRRDAQRSSLALLDALWDGDRAFKVDELAHALSLSPSAVRKVVKRLQPHGLVREIREGRHLLVEAATWPTPLNLPPGLVDYDRHKLAMDAGKRRPLSLAGKTLNHVQKGQAG